MEKIAEERDWIEKYLHIRNVFCGRCEAECTKERKLYCVEQFLYIIEMWEISNDGNQKELD